jgi:hypothetical protein
MAEVTTPALTYLWYVQFSFTTAFRFPCSDQLGFAIQRHPKGCHLLPEDPEWTVGTSLRPFDQKDEVYLIQ